MRTFIAIDLPLEVKEILATLRSDLPGVRWLPPEQLHLTLCFPGEIDEAQVAPLCHELQQIHLPSFSLTLDRPGCFPHSRSPRVLWVGIAANPQLTLLAQQVQRAAHACGIKLEERPFSPHLTLGRIREPRPGCADPFLNLHLPPLPIVEVQKFTLFASRLRPQGAEHRVLQHFPLTIPVR